MDSLHFNRQGIPQTLSDSQGAQISPPSSIGTSLSYQNYATGSMTQSQLPGSLGAVNVNDVRMMGSLPQSLYAAGPASFSEYNTGAAVDQRVALSSMMLSGGYNSYGDGFPQGPQSFSAIQGDNMHHMPVEADFGYALQRPGIVPSMDLSGASNVPPPRINPAAYSHCQIPPEHQRSRSFNHSIGAGGSLPQGRRASHGSQEMSGRQGLSQYMIEQGMCSATSIKEDATDYVLGGSMESALSSSFPTRSSAGSSATSSLLAQQLEGRSAGGMSNSSRGQYVSSSQPPAYLGAVSNAAAPGPASYAPAMPYVPHNGMPASADSAGYYYTTYITQNGAVMSAPVNMDMQSAAAAMQMHSYGSSYGSYADQQMPAVYGPPSSLHHQANLSQPSIEESKRNGSMPPPRANPHHYNHQGMSM